VRTDPPAVVYPDEANRASAGAPAARYAYSTVTFEATAVGGRAIITPCA